MRAARSGQVFGWALFVIGADQGVGDDLAIQAGDGGVQDRQQDGQDLEGGPGAAISAHPGRSRFQR